MLINSFSNFEYEAGTDEAGRGCLAGPVTAAAVILDKNFSQALINDSKKISEKTRDTLRPLIEQGAVCYTVTHVDHTTIDEINILNASIRAMQICIRKLKTTPLYIIVDGNQFKAIENIPHSCIVKGDEKFLSIAAASILAKTHRDEYMNKIHLEFPMYNWRKNKGYPTKEHRDAIRKYGISKYHRKSFRLLPEFDKVPFISECEIKPELILPQTIAKSVLI